MANGKSVKYAMLEVMVGNLKLGTDTLIFNMGSASECPSLKRGLCKLGKNCYALKAEKMYPQCKPYRDRQAEYWNNNSADTIKQDFYGLLTERKTCVNGKLVPLSETIKYFRFNESGDFSTQKDVRKLHVIAGFLKKHFNIITYGYTARSDLFYNKGLNFSLKGSGWKGPNGMTIARKLDKLTLKLGFHKELVLDKGTYEVCPMDCRTCTLCKTGNNNIVFPLH